MKTECPVYIGTVLHSRGIPLYICPVYYITRMLFVYTLSYISSIYTCTCMGKFYCTLRNLTCLDSTMYSICNWYTFQYYRSSCLFCEVQKFAFFTNGPSFVKFSFGLHNKTSNSYQKNCFVQSHMLAFHQYYSPRLLYLVITSNHCFHTEIVLHFCLLFPIHVVCGRGMLVLT